MSSPPAFRSDALSPGAVDRALREWSGFWLEVGDAEPVHREALAAAHDFFARPRAEKAALAIERSPHFRGWSEMHNERDWREQLHLGREVPAAGTSPDYLRLDGPNLWPSDPGFRRVVQQCMDTTAALGEQILAAAAQALGIDGAPFAGVARDGYLVMKLIGYHPQPSPTAIRPGVAPHVDFSWITLTLQDSPGLEARAPDGRWTLLEPRPGTLWVHAGELLQFATAGRYPAAPHRVINPSTDRMRVSIPLFVNPALTGTVSLLSAPTPSLRDAGADGEHIHRVLSPSARHAPFHFGEAEWQRKGLNRWCAVCVPGEAAIGTVG